MILKDSSQSNDFLFSLSSFSLSPPPFQTLFPPKSGHMEVMPVVAPPAVPSIKNANKEVKLLSNEHVRSIQYLSFLSATHGTSLNPDNIQHQNFQTKHFDLTRDMQPEKFSIQDELSMTTQQRTRQIMGRSFFAKSLDSYLDGIFGEKTFPPLIHLFLISFHFSFIFPFFFPFKCSI